MSAIICLCLALRSSFHSDESCMFQHKARRTLWSLDVALRTATFNTVTHSISSNVDLCVPFESYNRQCLFSYRTTSESLYEALINGSLQKIKIRVLVLGWYWMKLTANHRDLRPWKDVLQMVGWERPCASIGCQTPADILTSPKLLSILKGKQGSAIP